MTRGDIEIFTAADGSVVTPTGIIAVGAEVWFTSIGNDRVGRVDTTAGRLETFADPAGNVRLPANIHPAADGRVWFTCLGADRLAAIDPSAADPARTIISYPHPELARPVAIKSAPDGRLWISLRGNDSIASIDPRSEPPMASLRRYTSALVDEPSALFVHPDGTVWWVNAGSATIGRLHPDHPDLDGADPAAAIERFGPWPRWGAPRAWAIDPEGRLWITTQNEPGLLRLDPTATDIEDSARWFTDDRLQTPDGVWWGPDAALWLADTDARAIVRFEPDAVAGQAWTSFATVPALGAPFDIKTGGPMAAQSLWFTDKVGNAIGRILV